MGNDDEHVSSTEERVRRRLRDLRAERGLSLAEVAAAAGMAPSTLSRLESGRRRLALDHLPGLARALGTTADDLLAAPPRAADARVSGAPFVRDGITFWPLTRTGTGTELRAFKVRFPAAGERGAPVLRTHAGRDWLYVLAGRLRLVLGEDETVLGPGEAAEFDCRTPHWLGALAEPAEVLAIFGPHGERVHVRA